MNTWRVLGGTPILVVDAEESEKKPVSFRLIYEGPLLSRQSSDGKALKKNRHFIRKQFHQQLKELWESHTMLRTIARVPIQTFQGKTPLENATGIQSLSNIYSRGPYGFVPLVCPDFKLICSLDIPFLRRGEPGALAGGDIDNRIKTLLDGLQIPTGTDDIVEPIEEGEKPFFCLLENDRLVTEIKITTDRLLRPAEPTTDSHVANNVVLVLSVDINQTLRLW